jgi:hypothetical protein
MNKAEPEDPSKRTLTQAQNRLPDDPGPGNALVHNLKSTHEAWRRELCIPPLHVDETCRRLLNGELPKRWWVRELSLTQRQNARAAIASLR